MKKLILATILFASSMSSMAGNLSCHSKANTLYVYVNFDNHTITTSHSTVSTTLRMRELHYDNDSSLNIMAVSETYINENGIISAKSFCYEKNEKQYFIVVSNVANDDTLNMEMLSCKQVQS